MSKNYFKFIQENIPENRKVSVGDFVSIAIPQSAPVEGKILSFNEYFVALETYTGGRDMAEMQNIRDFAKGNDGNVIDYTVIPVTDIKSFTKYTKLEIDDGKKKA